MPRANQWVICSYIGCPEHVQGSTRCPEHTVKADDTYRPNAGKRGYDARWREFRKTYLHDYPECCVVGCERKATDVDHIDELGPLGPHGYDTNNLRSLCHQHHSSRTAASTHSKRARQ